MATQTLTLGGRKFVVLPQAEYRLLKAKSTQNGKSPSKAKRRPSRQERGDIAEARRRLARPGRWISMDQLVRELGLDPAALRK